MPLWIWNADHLCCYVSKVFASLELLYLLLHFSSHHLLPQLPRWDVGTEDGNWPEDYVSRMFSRSSHPSDSASLYLTLFQPLVSPLRWVLPEEGFSILIWIQPKLSQWLSGMVLDYWKLNLDSNWRRKERKKEHCIIWGKSRCFKVRLTWDCILVHLLFHCEPVLKWRKYQTGHFCNKKCNNLY